jgi:cyclophilin family peptidyl-prolyl cis-trans isomerase
MERPQQRTPAPSTLTPARTNQVRLLLIGGIGLAVLVLGFFVWRELRSQKSTSRWDDLDELQERYEPGFRQDPYFEDPAAEYRRRRDGYIRQLEAFLPRAREEDDALAPHVHWLIARAAADQVVALKDVTDASVRKPYYDRVIANLETIRDRYPEHPLNWPSLAPPGHATLTRMFLESMTSNLEWEQTHLPKDVAPAADPVVLVRTTRGDLRLGVYAEQAPAAVQLFLERARRGDYDGTAFFTKADVKRGPDDPLEQTIRGGLAATRGAPPFDVTAHAAFADATSYEPLLPAESRWRVPHAAGTVSVWHEPADAYDGSPVFVVCVERSPMLDYEHTPIGRLLDDASRATARRIFESTLWRDDPRVMAEPGEVRAVLDYFQAPVEIVKVLVYEGGALLAPLGEPAPSKAAAEESEQRLDAVKADQYRVPAPTRPLPPPPDEGAAGDAGGEGPGDDAPEGPGEGTGDSGGD